MVSARNRVKERRFVMDNVPYITAYILNNEVIILHKNLNSLLKFTPPCEVTQEQLDVAVNTAMSGLDWEEDFDVVFNTEKYRMAVMQVPYLLMS